MKHVLIGKIHSAQGIRGEVYVSIFAEEADWAEEWKTLLVSKNDEEQPSSQFKILKSRVHQKKKRWGFAMQLEGVSDRNRSEELVGLKVYIPEELLVTEADEGIYLREVLGFQVVDKQRGVVGEVVGFSGTNFQDIVVIKGEAGEFEVPFVDPILLETDKKNKKLLMDIPQGLVAGEEL